MQWYIEKRESTTVCTFRRYVTNRVGYPVASMIVSSYAFCLYVIGSKIEESYNKDFVLASYPYRNPPYSDPCASCNAVMMTM